MKKVDVVIIGAGAAGLMCAIEAGKRQRKTLLIDHANKIGKKILMSGGGKCNFTNEHIDPACYISHNRHFCKSALSRYTQWDFIKMVERHHIPYHEKTQGQLFCDRKSKDIVDMLLTECQPATDIHLNTHVEKIEKINDRHFKIKTNQDNYYCQSLVIATGGLSIPSMGASPFGYKIAEQFGIKIWPTRAGLVPLTLHTEDKARLSILSGIAVDSQAKTLNEKFRENILFTHRGLSGPAILQISSYWEAGKDILIDLLPDINCLAMLKLMQQQQPQKQLNSLLAEHLPKRVIETFIPSTLAKMKLKSISRHDLEQTALQMNAWWVKPNGTEGYRTAEVTLGGVDCEAISSKTMEAHQVPGLYFIGEVLDVAGWLGGFNFQWAWSSGWSAGQVV